MTPITLISWIIAAAGAATGASPSGTPAGMEPEGASADPRGELSAVADTVQDSRTLQEIVVSGSGARNRVGNLRFGTETLEIGRLSELPALFGESDLLKSITFMPGVQSEGEGGGGFEVRGGNASQNLVLLDGITLYNPSHVMGIFSTFNDASVGGATLYKGAVPPRYGGAVSSVLDVSHSSGDMRRWHGIASIGLLAAKVSASGPAMTDRLSVAVAARRSYADMFIAMIPKFKGTVMNFYDLSAKVRYRPSAATTADISFFMSHDNMAVKDVMGMYWGNLGLSGRFRHRITDGLSVTATAAYTDYAPKMSMSMMATDQVMRQYVRDLSADILFSVGLGSGHRMEAGVRSALYRVKSGEMRVNDAVEKDVKSGWMNAVWVDYAGTLSDFLEVTGGVRATVYTSLSGKRFNEFSATDEPAPDTESKTYVMPEPRVSLRFNIDGCHSVRGGVSATTQCLHSVRSSSTTFPFDRYALSSAGVRPQKGWQYGIGYAGMTEDGSFDWSVDGYWKDIRNVYDYRDGRTMFSMINLEDIILGGRGRSYGAELMVRKNSGRLTGWIAYTLSHTLTRIDGINGGRWYDASNDRRHAVNVTASYRFDDRWSLSATWIYSSGQPLTAPDLKYELNGVTCYYYSRRNGYRTPPTHRLDISAVYRRHIGRHLTSELSFGLYNAYCRLNPYVIYFQDDDSKPSGTRAVQQSLFGILPSISYAVKF